MVQYWTELSKSDARRKLGTGSSLLILLACLKRLMVRFESMTSLQPFVANDPFDGSHVPIRALEFKPPLWSTCDDEIELAAKQAFTAYELAMRRGHHPRLWQVVKGSPFQAHYKLNVKPQC